MTELKNERWSGPINSVTVNEVSPNIIDVLAVIPSNVGGWTIREMCVKDEEGNMIAICNTPDTEKVIITSGAAGEIEMLMHIEISNIAQLRSSWTLTRSPRRKRICGSMTNRRRRTRTHSTKRLICPT